MILNYSDEKFNTKTKVLLQCDKCGSHQQRPYKKYVDLVENNDAFDMDYCEPCWSKIRQKTPTAKKKMSEAIRNMIEEDPNWKVRNSESKKGIIHLGDSNPMKNPKTSKKVSSTRKKLLSDPTERQKISDNMRKAWADGKYDGVKVGISKWYTYKHSNGNEYKVQGTWELAFIEWLDENNMEFECHRGRIPYKLNGKDKNYYPDFWVNEWNCWVDIKNKYHYTLQEDKFKALAESGHNIKLIFKKDLEQLTNKKL